ncbi:MAG: hypothetical protein LBU75_15105 [Desulfovibrio sp.]|jgi:hypothetical protein|nr:hypothetical protein [Desulfovibrio sp.]
MRDYTAFCRRSQGMKQGMQHGRVAVSLQLRAALKVLLMNYYGFVAASVGIWHAAWGRNGAESIICPGGCIG